MNNKKIRRIRRLKKKSEFKVRDFTKEIIIGSQKRLVPAYSNPKCYANIFNECDEAISKEHFVSQSILNNFETILPENVEYLKGEIKNPIKPNALAVKCLCEYHNSLLSDLDGMIGHFFDEIMRFHDEKNRGVIFNGKSIEKWFVKCLLGYMATNKLHHNGIKYSLNDIDPSLVEFLFKDTPLKEEIGLYFAEKLGDNIRYSKRVKLQALFLEKRFSGITITFGGFQFYFSLEPREKAFNESDSKTIVMYRPKCLNKKGSKDFLKISW